MKSMYKASRFLLLLVTLLTLLDVTGCISTSQPDASSVSPPKKGYEDVIIGYAQIGAESEWRAANTKSIKDTAEQLGIELKFLDAQQKQENQIEAVRKLIIQKVDLIGISPIVEDGWDEVFREARDAGIPIILVDRRANVPADLYVTYLGSDFLEEGRNAARMLTRLVDGKAKIVELAGTIGSAPANDRYQGFRQVLANFSQMDIIESQSGDFTRAGGRELMRLFLEEHGDSITAVFAHNDDMALGAITAIEEYGLKPGVDIKIVSVDAARGAFEAMIEGKLNATIECNPLLGPGFFEIAMKVINGEPVPKWVASEEGIFLPDNALEVLPTRKY
jgi:ABC-type sugar transport system substrate-binding protein